MIRLTATLLLIGFLCTSSHVPGQTVGKWLPEQINKKASYIFYLHGGVVTRFGDNAINSSAPEWGPYQYLKILDSLRSLGFHVISENRKLGINDSVYVGRLARQVDTLLRAKIPPRNILVLGASAGWDIGVRAAPLIKNKNMNFVLMGGCWPNTYKDFTKIRLIGNFLSVIEESDPHKTCSAIFQDRNEITSFKEVKLNTGLSHGFFYKPRKVWIDPVLEWWQHKPQNLH
jgi:hypothetical protein